MPLLVVAAYRWDRFGRDWRSYIGPVAFGLAMAVKQTPWPILPFLLLALALDERTRTNLTEGARRAGRYLLAVVIAFLIPNIPYILAAPSAWLRGTFTPIFKTLVPAGQGAIGFSLFLHIGGGSLQAFTLLFVLVFVLLLVAYVGMYPLLRATTFAIPAIAYFFAVRSYASYLVALVPPGIVAAITADAFPMVANGKLFVSRNWRLAVSGVAAACALAALYAGTAGSPLSVQISQVDVSGAANIGQEITLRVTNNSSSTQRPYFTIETSSGVSSFWHISGSKLIKPGVTRYFVISSSDQASQFSLNNGLTVLAFLTHPASVSASNHYQPELWHIGFRPQAEDQLIPLCKPLRIHVQLLNEWDTPLAREDVPIWIAQSVFGGGIANQIASINGQPPGHGDEIFTNAHGVASFAIVGEKSDFYPLTLNASIDEQPGVNDYYPDPSQTLLLRFADQQNPAPRCAAG
jgi:heme/copper-type cytochrome/quinol oxidase subunit 4